MERSQSLSQPPSRQLEETSPKRRLLAFLLCFFFGFHRFYVGKFWTGLLFVCTGGGLGVWWLVDLVLIATGQFRDSEGRLLGSGEKRRHRQLDSERNRDAGPPTAGRQTERRETGRRQRQQGPAGADGWTAEAQERNAPADGMEAGGGWTAAGAGQEGSSTQDPDGGDGWTVEAEGGEAFDVAEDDVMGDPLEKEFEKLEKQLDQKES